MLFSISRRYFKAKMAYYLHYYALHCTAAMDSDTRGSQFVKLLITATDFKSEMCL